ncbi:hypothetical protein TrVE_jg8780 [Triparma verrucosa]|uniref:Uncharacterized protein n=1 Tax=Triparma verrucosa TaxID=1606542 RepID=A0A9W6ZB37_9STRA|nr:hypothetical protein TrVE_jg8780 [Triparma verrucosa]
MPHTSSAGSGNRSPSPSTLRMLRLRSLSSMSDQLSEQKEINAQEGTLNEAVDEERKAGIFYDRGQEQGQGGGQQGGKGGDGLPTLIPPELPNLSQDLKFDSKSSSYLHSTLTPSLPVLTPPSLPSTSSPLLFDPSSLSYLSSSDDVSSLKQRVQQLESQVQYLLSKIPPPPPQNNQPPPTPTTERQNDVQEEAAPAWHGWNLIPLIKYLGLCVILTVKESTKPTPLVYKILKSITFVFLAFGMWYFQNFDFSTPRDENRDRFWFLRVGRGGGRGGDLVWFVGSWVFSLWPGWEMGEGEEEGEEEEHPHQD